MKMLIDLACRHERSHNDPLSPHPGWFVWRARRVRLFPRED